MALCLLAVAAGLAGVGAAAWAGVQAQLSLVEEQYTTIAVPKSWIAEMARDAALNSPQTVAEDARGLLSAHVKGMEALVSGMGDPLTYQQQPNRPCSLSILAVRCTGVNIHEDIVSSYVAYFDLLDVVSRLPAYDEFPEISGIALPGYLWNEDGSVPFQEGKTYLLFGEYQGRQIEQGYVNGGLGLKPSDLTWGFLYDLTGSPFDTGKATYEVGEGEIDGQTYCYLKEGSLPFFAEYTGDWRNFLDSAEAKVWREDFLPACQVSHESAPVIFTDNLMSMYWFNTGVASILEGRSFTAEEYKEGALACIVSTAYAQLNGLEVGDILTLDFYDTGVSSGEIIDHFTSELESYYVRQICTPENRIGLEQDYQIVGIYTAPQFEYGEYAFQADTIFVTKGSIPNAADYEAPVFPLLSTIILKNGSADEFQAYMATQNSAGFYGDMREAYLCFDQSYEDTAGALEALAANAARLLAVGAAAFVLAGLVFLLLNLRRMAPVARSMRLLGQSAGAVWREMLWALIPSILLAVLLGVGLSAALYGRVTQALLSETLNLQWGALALCAGGEAVFLMLAGGIWSRCAARRKLMGGRSAGKA